MKSSIVLCYNINKLTYLLTYSPVVFHCVLIGPAGTTIEIHLTITITTLVQWPLFQDNMGKPVSER